MTYVSKDMLPLDSSRARCLKQPSYPLYRAIKETEVLSIHTERSMIIRYGPLTRYVKLRVEHAPGMSGAFSPPPTSKGTASKRSRYASRHVRHARAVMHVGIAISLWRGKRSRHSRHMRKPQFYVSGKRPITGVLRNSDLFAQHLNVHHIVAIWCHKTFHNQIIF